MQPKGGQEAASLVGPGPPSFYEAWEPSSPHGPAATTLSGHTPLQHVAVSTVALARASGTSPLPTGTSADQCGCCVECLFTTCGRASQWWTQGFQRGLNLSLGLKTLEVPEPLIPHCPLFSA